MDTFELHKYYQKLFCFIGKSFNNRMLLRLQRNLLEFVEKIDKENEINNPFYQEVYKTIPIII